MTERTKTGNKRPMSRTRSVRKSYGGRGRKRGEALGAGTSSLVLLPWALALLGATAVLAAATVIGR